jgi:hypothetical protein
MSMLKKRAVPLSLRMHIFSFHVILTYYSFTIKSTTFGTACQWIKTASLLKYTGFKEIQDENAESP